MTDYEKYRGKCYEYSAALVMDYPDLKLVRGHYYDAQWGEQAHWWTETKSGVIVDPTVNQFPSKGHGVYIPFDGICTCEVCGKEKPEEEMYFMSRYPVCSDYCARTLVGV